MKNEEHQLQVEIVKLLKLKGYVCFSIPNHGMRSPRLGAYYKAEGLLPGVADLFILSTTKNKGIFVEVKSQKGKQQETQKQFQNDCKVHGYDYWLIKSLDEFLTKLNEYENISNIINLNSNKLNL